MNMFATNRTRLLAAIAAAGIAAPAAVFAAASLGDKLGASEDAIRQALETQGYTVLEIESEDDGFEAEVSKDGQVFEIEIAGDTGLVTGIELEDEDDGDNGEDDDD